MELKLNPRKEKKMNSKTREQYWAKGWVPAAVHGRSISPGICFVDTKSSQNWRRGSMFDVTWEGQNFKASIDELQYSPVGNKLLHISFQLVGRNEITNIDIPVKIKGQAPGEKEGGMIQIHLESLTVQGQPDDIPPYYEINVENLQVGKNISMGDLTPPQGCKWYNLDEERTVLTCAHIKTRPLEDEQTEASQGEIPPQETTSSSDSASPEEKEAA